MTDNTWDGRPSDPDVSGWHWVERYSETVLRCSRLEPAFWIAGLEKWDNRSIDRILYPDDVKVVWTYRGKIAPPEFVPNATTVAAMESTDRVGPFATPEALFEELDRPSDDAAPPLSPRVCLVLDELIELHGDLARHHDIKVALDGFLGKLNDLGVAHEPLRALFD